MKTTIFYYSATGNSLAVARKLAEGLGGAELRPLAAVVDSPFKPDCERMGIVFPVIAWGPPRTVTEFVERLDPSGVDYAFAVASCGGSAAGSLPRIRAALRKKGGELDAGFIVRSPSYMPPPDPESQQAKMIELVRKLSGPLPLTDDERIDEIVAAVAAGRRSKPERNALPGSIVGNFLHDQAAPKFAGMDALYAAADTCDGCGLCARVCPRANIAMEGGKPAWRHDCEFCGACATWCPRSSIGFAGAAPAPRSRNRSARAGDFVLR